MIQLISSVLPLGSLHPLRGLRATDLSPLLSKQLKEGQVDKGKTLPGLACFHCRQTLILSTPNGQTGPITV